MYIVLFSTMFEGAMYEYEVQVATSREAAKARTARLAVERYIVPMYKSCAHHIRCEGTYVLVHSTSYEVLCTQ